MKKIGIIHTTPATIESLKGLVDKTMDDVEVINILDDSILPHMRDGNQTEFVRERWISYAGILERLGAHVIVSACSTVGEYAEEANALLKVPVVRIDEAMARKAVEMGICISVFATLKSTLDPTVRLIGRMAEEAGKDITVNTILVEGAYEALMEGDKGGHDRRIKDAVKEWADKTDVIVLAQASMASAIQEGGEASGKILTSPALGINGVKRMLESM